MSKTYKEAFKKVATIANAALDGLEDEITNVGELMQKNNELKRKIHQFKKMNIECLDLLASDTEKMNAMQDRIDVIEQQNAEMLAML